MLASIVIRTLDECACEVVDVEVVRPSLDDVFLTITGKPADDDQSEEAS